MSREQPVKRTPCRQCPFRRKSMAGWLGCAAPEGFITSILHEERLPCHPTIDYESKTWKRDWLTGKKGVVCAGSLVLAANMGKRPRDPSFPLAEPDRETVFATAQEFVDHHRASPVRSWDLEVLEKEEEEDE